MCVREREREREEYVCIHMWTPFKIPASTVPVGRLTKSEFAGALRLMGADRGKESFDRLLHFMFEVSMCVRIFVLVFGRNVVYVYKGMNVNLDIFVFVYGYVDMEMYAYKFMYVYK